MNKLVVPVLVVTILTALGGFTATETQRPGTVSAGTSTSVGLDDLPEKHIVPRPEPRREPLRARASRHRTVTQSDVPLTDSSVWDRLAQCESGGNWNINTGNGYYGGIQFDLTSWRSAGGKGYPHLSGRNEQIKRGKIWQHRYGWKPWPACARKLGLL